MKKCLVSVIVAVYNANEYLENTIKALMEQSYKNIEIILIDDGSSDASLQTCNLYSKKDNRIIVIHQENKGPGSARNRGIIASRGEYLVFVDSDDYVSPNYVENLLVAILKNNYDVAIAGFYKRYSDGSTQKNLAEETSSEKKDLSQEIEYLVKNALIQGPCWKIFKKEIIILNNVIFHESWKYGEDSYFVYNYLQYVNSWTSIPVADYYYEIRNSDSLSNKFTREKIRNSIELMKLLKQLCQENEKNVWMNEMICGCFITYCDDLVSTDISLKNKIQNIVWAVENVNKSGWLDNYREKHIVRKIYQFGIKHNFFVFLYSIALFRKIAKNILCKVKKGKKWEN